MVEGHVTARSCKFESCSGHRAFAQVAELVDALHSGCSGRTPVQVRVLSWALGSDAGRLTGILILIATELTTLSKKSIYVAVAVAIAFLTFHSQSIHSQCKSNQEAHGSCAVEGIANGPDYYYQNLIIQDIALAQHKPFSEIALRFDYSFGYTIDYCKTGQVTLNLLSAGIVFPSLLYYGYDISSSLFPSNADVVFHIVQNNDISIDSLNFLGIPLAYDTGLYVSMDYKIDPSVSDYRVRFAGAGFYFTRTSYERFRDRLLEVDDYYAAAVVADSALAWYGNDEDLASADRAALITRRMELERITSLVNPRKFALEIHDGANDLSGLLPACKLLQLQLGRLDYIIRNGKSKPWNSDRSGLKERIIGEYHRQFETYRQLTYHSDFRFVSFLGRMADPGLTAGYLLYVKNYMADDLGVPEKTSRSWGRAFAASFISRGENMEKEGEQLRALSYYSNALVLSRTVHDYQLSAIAMQKTVSMRDSIAFSYTAISRKSALSGNPSLAARYFRQAEALYAEVGEGHESPAWLKAYAFWLFDNFGEQVPLLIDLKNYQKAHDYLVEIESYCMNNPGYPCPALFIDWMKKVRNGLYISLLNKADGLIARDELQDGEAAFRQAVALRSRGSYRVEKDILETKLDIYFKQQAYNQVIEEGQRFFDLHEYNSALYYFNKANVLEKSGISTVDPDLEQERNLAAHKVIAGILSEGRVKAWANDEENVTTILQRLDQLLSDYQVPSSDSLSLQYIALKEDVRQNKCDRVVAEYDALIRQADSAKNAGNYLLAGDLYADAAGKSIANINCRISDDKAWFGKVLLEMPARYQEMEIEMDKFLDVSWSNYLAAFLELRSFYYRHKLLDEGVTFIPLFDRIIKAETEGFLGDAVDYYLEMRDPGHALRVLERMNQAGISMQYSKVCQKKVATALAVKDAMEGTVSRPWTQMREYAGQDGWYKPFRWGYRSAWLKETGGKIKYWPVIWKK